MNKRNILNTLVAALLATLFIPFSVGLFYDLFDVKGGNFPWLAGIDLKWLFVYALPIALFVIEFVALTQIEAFWESFSHKRFIGAMVSFAIWLVLETVPVSAVYFHILHGQFINETQSHQLLVSENNKNAERQRSYFEDILKYRTQRAVALSKALASIAYPNDSSQFQASAQERRGLTSALSRMTRGTSGLEAQLGASLATPAIQNTQSQDFLSWAVENMFKGKNSLAAGFAVIFLTFSFGLGYSIARPYESSSAGAATPLENILRLMAREPDHVQKRLATKALSSVRLMGLANKHSNNLALQGTAYTLEAESLRKISADLHDMREMVNSAKISPSAKEVLNNGINLTTQEIFKEN